MSKSISEVCLAARDLIIRDGFQTGGGGWIGDGGWCIEGALWAAMGNEIVRGDGSRMEAETNGSPAGRAIREHLISMGFPMGDYTPLHSWNDRSATKVLVLRVLMEVAQVHGYTPHRAVVPVVPDWTDPGEGFWRRLWACLTASTTEPEPEPTDPSPEPPDGPEEGSEETVKELVSV